jgi:hypothetical protein
MSVRKSSSRLPFAARKHRRGVNPAAVEPLEGRQLMSASLLVPAVRPSAVVAAGDLNGDQKADLVRVINFDRIAIGRAGITRTSEAALQVQLGKGDGSFGDGSVRFLLPAVQVANVATGDFDGDGSVDVALVEGARSAHPGAVHLLQGNGDGTLQPHVLAGQFKGIGGELHVADFNGDGVADLAVERRGIIAILIGLLRQQKFAEQQNAILPYIDQNVRDVAAGDFNNDGHADIAALLGDGSVRIARNDKLLNFTDEGPEEDVKNIISVAAGDVNGDGFQDLASFGDGSVFVSLGSERGLLPAVQSQLNLLPAVQRNLHLADVDGDGSVDLLFTDFIGRPHVVAYGQADGTFSRMLGGKTGPIDVLG